jgi:hypothetical protein
MNNLDSQHFRRHKTSKPLLLLLIVWIMFAIGAILFRRDMLDWAALRSYTAPAAIAALAGDDTMTPQATRMFYVNHPSIEEKITFASRCSNHQEQTIVLGCYHGNQQGIYMLKVSDSRLDGVEEVTAAHEMLHAAYDRLNARERTHIDSLLQDYYDKQVKDTRIRTTIDAYKQSEPRDVINEMHSVLGTEVGNLPLELETYYQRYFSNRSKVVSYAAAYANEFTSRQGQVVAYDAQLKGLKVTIDATSAVLEQQLQGLSTTRQQLEADRANSDVTSYNQRVNAYNAAVVAYNVAVVEAKQLIAQYNDLVEKRNIVALEEQQLAKAISGDSVPSSAQ